MLCRLRKKLAAVGLLIQTSRIGKDRTYKGRAYRLIDVASKPTIYPNAEEKAA